MKAKIAVPQITALAVLLLDKALATTFKLDVAAFSATNVSPNDNVWWGCRDGTGGRGRFDPTFTRFPFVNSNTTTQSVTVNSDYEPSGIACIFQHTMESCTFSVLDLQRVDFDYAIEGPGLPPPHTRNMLTHIACNYVFPSFFRLR
jgi:hypothetical protein